LPELPDVELYVEHLRRRIAGQKLLGFRLRSPFLLRTVQPRPTEAVGKTVRDVRRIGKRIVLAMDDDLFLVLHLMIAGRLQWKPPGAKPPGRIGLAAFDFPPGTLLFTEAATRKRASLHVVRGTAALAALDPGGLEPLGSSPAAFREALLRENHTLKRALTDPHLFSGIGNAYSDEILHRARLSPVKTTRTLQDEELARLHAAVQTVLVEWMDRLRAQAGETFPAKVTAFRPEMAVHGRYGKPCPACGAPVQRIVHAENEVNYCAACQTGGKLLADRALSRLLHEDWPKTLEELDELRAAHRGTFTAETRSPRRGQGAPGTSGS
jgi:formamidopyrimidine-DNA glycosylase